MQFIQIHTVTCF